MIPACQGSLGIQRVHRKRSVESEAFYVVMGIKEDKTREVLGIFNRSKESATGWGEMFQTLQERGVHKIDLLVADGIRFLVDALGRYFPNTPLQKCSAPVIVVILLNLPGKPGGLCA